MKSSSMLAIALTAITAAAASAAPPRQSAPHRAGGILTKAEPASNPNWERVTVPHDWAIYGPFSRDNDLQVVAVEQNGESVPTEKTGRTGGLPFIGKGYYKTEFEVADTTGRAVTLVFDGAMSNAHVSVNGKEVMFWPYGYNSFYVDVTPEVVPGSNTLEVSLENYERASRWYPGAGLYRNVHVVETDRVHIPV
ncbi:MAG: beta-galactosidase, partial [Paramuribaculum sp.]|nr:beta-galactosidase [Paramuribaculum sp.]